MSLKVIQGSSTKKPGQERISLLIPPSIEKIISDSIAMEAEDAKETGRLGFMARALIQATMPHSDPGNVSAWQRVNGNFALFHTVRPHARQQRTYSYRFTLWLHPKTIISLDILGSCQKERTYPYIGTNII